MNTNAVAVFVSSISALIALGALLFSIIQGKRREKKLEKRNELLEVKNDFLENRRYIDMLNKITEIMINIDDQIIQNPELDCLFEKNGRINNDQTNEIRHKYFAYKMLDLMQVIYITFYDSTKDYRTYRDCLEYLKKYDKHVELHVKSWLEYYRKSLVGGVPLRKKIDEVLEFDNSDYEDEFKTFMKCIFI